MPAITCMWYSHHVVDSNPELTFLFGDNAARTGKRGQAEFCRDKPNCHGIRTKWRPSNRPWSFFGDADYDRCVAMLDEDFVKPLALAHEGKMLVLPLGGIGTGFAQVEQHAPRVFRYLQDCLAGLIRIANEGVIELPPEVSVSSPQAALMQRIAHDARIMLMWTIYDKSPTRPPGRELDQSPQYTARPMASGNLPPLRYCMSDANLDNLRRRLPNGLSRLPREAGDTPDVVETWF